MTQDHVLSPPQKNPHVLDMGLPLLWVVLDMGLPLLWDMGLPLLWVVLDMGLPLLWDMGLSLLWVVCNERLAWIMKQAAHCIQPVHIQTFNSCTDARSDLGRLEFSPVSDSTCFILENDEFWNKWIAFFGAKSRCFLPHLYSPANAMRYADETLSFHDSVIRAT